MALLRLLSSLTPERVTSASPRPEPRRKISKVGDIGLSNPWKTASLRRGTLFRTLEPEFTRT